MNIKEKILLVDDDENILSSYTRILKKHFNVETANSGAKALELISKNEPYAVIVSDMQMPEMDGIEFLVKAKKDSPLSTVNCQLSTVNCQLE